MTKKVKKQVKNTKFDGGSNPKGMNAAPGVDIKKKRSKRNAEET